MTSSREDRCDFDELCCSHSGHAGEEPALRCPCHLFFEIISVLAPLFSVASVLMGPPTGCCFFSFCWQLFLVPCPSLALFTRFTRLVKK